MWMLIHPMLTCVGFFFSWLRGKRSNLVQFQTALLLLYEIENLLMLEALWLFWGGGGGGGGILKYSDPI